MYWRYTSVLFVLFHHISAVRSSSLWFYLFKDTPFTRRDNSPYQALFVFFSCYLCFFFCFPYDYTVFLNIFWNYKITNHWDVTINCIDWSILSSKTRTKTKKIGRFLCVLCQFWRVEPILFSRYTMVYQVNHRNW